MKGSRPMEFSSIFRRGGKIVSDNAPALFTAAAVVGTVATAYLTGRAVIRAEQIVFNYEQEARHLTGDEEYEINTQKRAELTWREYIPPVVMGVCTIGSIIAAHRIETRRTAAALAAFAISEKVYDEYKEKVTEKLGVGKEQRARDEIAQRRVSDDPRVEEYALLGDGKSSLCYDLFTGRPFISDIETLRRAENDINYQINRDYFASLSDFYDRVGLERTSMSDDFGWNADKLLELHFSTALTPSGQPCVTMDFRVAPIRGFQRLQ